MNTSDRIQTLRKSRGISQEELADKIGVSRQAVSKWESEQSTPDLEKIIIMSDYFGVTTDYILKGIEPTKDNDQRNNELTSRILYIASTAFVAIGLFCAFGGWYEEQTLEVVWGSLIIQAVGIAGYYIGKLFSTVKAPFCVDWLNIVGIAFVPVSILTGFISQLVFSQGEISPYPSGITHFAFFSVLYCIVLFTGFVFVKKRNQ